ncbi:hypothetical protein F511_37214 [Dorcoceras hygrometricum]|uniref:Uncharacterized protein n=1 Tax=Dorcoceras hygrometricum TaxID=472368 RepID=A0A2Z7C130_9LAMI|nr:hypothetical protein F511_37214 [Dorcoceras hygrometricum]
MRQPDRSSKDRNDKKIYRKKRSEKVLVAEENKSSRADTDSEESRSGTQAAGANHRSVILRVRQPITARWYLDTTNQSVTTPMIELDLSGTTNHSVGHNVAFNQISPGTANLKPSHTGHGNSAVSLLEAQIHKLTLTEERSGKISQKASNEQALRVSSNPRFQSPNWYQSVKKLKRSSAPLILIKTTRDTAAIDERVLG